MNSTLSSSQRPGKLDALVYALLPLAFIGSPFLNCIAFVLDGHRHDVFRSLFVLSIQCVSVIVFRSSSHPAGLRPRLSVGVPYIA